MDNIDSDVINPGQYIVIQRQNYMKLHNFARITSTITLGNDRIELSNIQNCQYYSTFKMIKKNNEKQRIHSLEIVENYNSSLKDGFDIQKSGFDNRNIIDDGKSQKLTAEEIENLKNTTSDSTSIIEALVINSNTFHSKTEYSQEKYLKKKEKKYFEFLFIRKPTIRLIADIMYRQDPTKILCIKSDILSQLISYSNIHGNSDVLLYDSGTNGLIPSAILNSIGTNTKGKLVYLHPGNTAQKQGILAMNYSAEQINRCIFVNIYSVLRHFYQNNTSENMANSTITNINKRKISEVEVENLTESEKNKRINTGKDEEITEIDNTVKKPPIWILENEKACLLLYSKLDSLIITCKEHPLNIFKELLPFIKIGRPFVIYHQYREPLQECYTIFKKMPNVTNLRLTSSWLREYQVLPDRTHPDVTMQNNNGYIMTGWVVQ